ncbi:MAG: FAD:protein FMN transferase [Peptococcaceae bacterium]|nr:FAD:protein FMN transferase [Peptococcaceae bacterium]
MSKEVIGLSFHSMDTLVEVRAIADRHSEEFKAALQQTPQWFAQVEDSVSRFKPGTELSQVNQANGGTFAVSPIFLTLMEQSLQAARHTGGIFNPTIVDCLVNSGYKKSFGAISGKSSGRKILSVHQPVAESQNRLLTDCEAIKVDVEQGTVTLPPEVGLDFGGIAKGWAVDQCLTNLLALGKDAEICVNAGGDLRLYLPKGGEAWQIDIQNPFDLTKDLAVACLQAGAVATSSVLKRRWWSGGSYKHHIIDPRTGQPSESNIVAATVIGPTAMEAEVWSKTLCILGVEEGFALLDRQTGWAALSILNNGQIIINRQMEGITSVTDASFAMAVHIAG